MNDEISQSDVIRRIKDASRDCLLPKLDEQVLAGPEPQLKAMLYALTIAETDMFLDIPVSAVVSLQHHNFFELGATWRSAVLGLQGEDWDESVLGYLEGPLRDTHFPVTTKMPSALDLTCFGGAVCCWNGAHRLSAMVVWLSHVQGSGATLRLAPAAIRMPRGDAVSRLVKMSDSGEILFADLSTTPAAIREVAERSGEDCVFAVRHRTRTPSDYAVATSTGDLVPMSRRPKGRSVEGLHPLDKLWQPLPKSILAAWRTRHWMDASVKSGELRTAVGRDRRQ